MHRERIFDNQELPKIVDVKIVSTLRNIGDHINALPESELVPNCSIKTFEGRTLPGVWYLHTGIPKSERRTLQYKSLDFFGQHKEYSFKPSGWVLTENHWFPLVTRLLRVIGPSEIKQNPEIFDRVAYFDGTGTPKVIAAESRTKLLTSLGAAENPFFIVYLETDKRGKILPSPTLSNWLIMDTKNVGYKSCGIGKRVYGPGCYFGGFWTCADRGSAKKVDESVCKIKTPPWPTRYFWAIIDDVVFNADGGSSIKAGRIKLLNADQNKTIPDWISPHSLSV